MKLIIRGGLKSSQLSVINDLDYVLFNDPPAENDVVVPTSSTFVILKFLSKREKSEKTPKSDGGINMKKFVSDNKI